MALMVCTVVNMAAEWSQHWGRDVDLQVGTAVISWSEELWK